MLTGGLVHASRDRILLDGDDVDEGEDEEEVFALRGVSSDSDSDDDQLESDGMQVDSEPATSKSKSKSKTARDAKKSSAKDASDSEEEETWGRSKGAYYASNAAELDSEDDEANELEEQEALRLQAKAREGMCDQDFGLGDVVEGDIEPLEATYTCRFVIHAAAEHRRLGNKKSRRFCPPQGLPKTSSLSYAHSKYSAPRHSRSRETGTTQPTTSSTHEHGSRRKSHSLSYVPPPSPFM